MKALTGIRVHVSAGIIMSLIARSCSNTACSVRLFLSYLKDALISVAIVWWTKWKEPSVSYKWAVYTVSYLIPEYTMFGIFCLSAV